MSPVCVCANCLWSFLADNIITNYFCVKHNLRTIRIDFERKWKWMEKEVCDLRVSYGGGGSYGGGSSDELFVDVPRWHSLPTKQTIHRTTVYTMITRKIIAIKLRNIISTTNITTLITSWISWTCVKSTKLNILDENRLRMRIFLII